MNKVIDGLAVAVFGITCLFLSWVLTLVSKLVPGLELPPFTQFCVSFRPVLLVLPVLALGYCVYVWFSKNDTRKSWVGFFEGTIRVVVFVMALMIVRVWLLVLNLTSALGSS